MNDANSAKFYPTIDSTETKPCTTFQGIGLIRVGGTKRMYEQR